MKRAVDEATRFGTRSRWDMGGSDGRERVDVSDKNLDGPIVLAVLMSVVTSIAR